MTWHVLTDLAHEQLVTETHMDELRENVEHLGSFGFGGTAFSALTANTNGALMAVGTYTGNGAATQAVTGLGFQPAFLIIYPKSNVGLGRVKSSQDGGTNSATITGGSGTFTDDIISLDTDGFTVGDGTGSPYGNALNANTGEYVFVAFS